MKKILLCSVILLSIFSRSFGVNQVYTMGYTVGIMADDQEWDCKTVPSSRKGPVMQGKKYIYGKSKHFPIRFDFFSYSIVAPNRFDLLDRNIVNFFKHYGERSNTIFLDVDVKESATRMRVYEGRFVDNNSSGYFRFYLEWLDGNIFMMLSRIDSELYDEQSRNLLYDSAQELITPLYNPKALSLWLEGMEKSYEECLLE